MWQFFYTKNEANLAQQFSLKAYFKMTTTLVFLFYIEWLQPSIEETQLLILLSKLFLHVLLMLAINWGEMFWTEGFSKENAINT